MKDWRLSSLFGRANKLSLEWSIGKREEPWKIMGEPLSKRIILKREFRSLKTYITGKLRFGEKTTQKL